MAISKILSIKECHKAYSSKHLKQSIDYILNPEKTCGGTLTGSHNCLMISAYEQMMRTKELFGKSDKRQGYHLIISFGRGEVDEETALRIVGKFTEKYLDSEYEAVYAIHNNTDLIHGHIIFNSVSCNDGRKFRYERGDWAKYIQPLVNRLCEEYNLSTLDIEVKGQERRKKPEITSDKGSFSIWKRMIIKDVDEAILKADNYEQFIAELKNRNYEVKEGKYLAIRPPGVERFRRMKTLGDEYTEARIRSQINDRNILPEKNDIINHAPRILSCRYHRHFRRKLSSLQRRYISMLYRIGKLKKHPYSQAYKYRAEIKKMRRLQEQSLFLKHHNVETGVQLLAVEDKLQQVRKGVQSQLRHVYRKKALYKNDFLLLDEVTSLTRAENAYQAGNMVYQDHHERFDELCGLIKKHGYSVEELRVIKDRFDVSLAELRAKERLVRNELATAGELIKGRPEESLERIENRVEEISKEQLR